MPYGIMLDVAAPVEVYDRIHAHLMEQGPRASEGLVMHVGHATESGFRVVEVWESREAYDRFTHELMVPMMTAMDPEHAGPQPVATEFEVRGLVIPGAHVLA